MLRDLIPMRYLSWAVCGLGLLLSLLFFDPDNVLSFVWVAVFGALTVLGGFDFFQDNHAIRRNYPVIGRLRFALEYIRPEIRQYFVESDTEAVPFSRMQRSLVYQRAKDVVDKRPFGTLDDVYGDGYEYINHSMATTHIDDCDFRVNIGTAQCSQPYSASLLNVSAMSFGSLSANAVMALNRGAELGGYAQDTGEGSISRYHLEHNGDLIWEIGSGYFGCRNPDGSFSVEEFRKNAVDPQVKMIEIKISQGAKPGHGGVLPGPKVTEEIARARGVQVGEECVSPASHSAFSTPVEFLQFMDQLRELSGGKPVGFKMCIGQPWEFFAICKAMLKTGSTPDYIVIDGAEGGTGAAPAEFINHMGAPMRQGLTLAHNTLVGLNLRDRIRLGAAGKVVSAFDMARCLALGADWCNAGRGFMFSIGCVMARICHTGRCPTGVTTQNPWRQRGLDPTDKGVRAYNFHRNTMLALGELLGAAGLSHPSEFGPHHISRLVSNDEVAMLSKFVDFLEPGELLENRHDHPVYNEFWHLADPDSFYPVQVEDAREAASMASA